MYSGSQVSFWHMLTKISCVGLIKVKVQGLATNHPGYRHHDILMTLTALSRKSEAPVANEFRTHTENRAFLWIVYLNKHFTSSFVVPTNKIVMLLFQVTAARFCSFQPCL